LPVADLAVLGRAALVADLGAVGVPSGVWERAGPLGTDEHERVRLHPYLSERVLCRCTGLAPEAALAGAHHERLDGSGYHRGSTAPQLPSAARLLAAADVWTALRQDRPHRPAHAPARARDVLWAEVTAGRLDATAAEAVLSCGGQAAHRRSPRPAGLSDREGEVLRLVARGHSNRAVAAQLSISAKTVGHHVGHIYAKIGVSTRPAAALFAMEQRPAARVGRPTRHGASYLARIINQLMSHLIGERPGTAPYSGCSATVCSSAASCSWARGESMSIARSRREISQRDSPSGAASDSRARTSRFNHPNSSRRSRADGTGRAGGAGDPVSSVPVSSVPVSRLRTWPVPPQRQHGRRPCPPQSAQESQRSTSRR
jgi:DNA-binding CsgD family transcriptional regulator